MSVLGVEAVVRVITHLKSPDRKQAEVMWKHEKAHVFVELLHVFHLSGAEFKVRIHERTNSGAAWSVATS